MRTTNLYQFYDTEAGAVAGPIISEKADAVAIRAFHATLANKDSLPGHFPAHFHLYKLAEQDEETGRIERNAIVIIATGHAWLLQQQEANNAQPPITPR